MNKPQLAKLIYWKLKGLKQGSLPELTFIKKKNINLKTTSNSDNVKEQELPRHYY